MPDDGIAVGSERRASLLVVMLPDEMMNFEATSILSRTQPRAEHGSRSSSECVLDRVPESRMG